MDAAGTPSKREDWIDPQWLGEAIAKDTETSKQVAEESLAGAGGLSAEMRRLRVTFNDGSKTTLVVKCTDPGRLASSKQLGLWRVRLEAFFYNSLGKQFGALLPRVVYAHGNPESGLKVMIMEDLSDCVQTGYYFENHSPHNWGKDLAALTSDGATQLEIATSAFKLAARIHAAHQLDKSLLSMDWLRGADWARGEGEESWNGTQAYARGHWEKTKEKIKNGQFSDVQWDDNLIACMDASFQKSTWSALQQRFASEPWSLVHGDFHPANMMWRPKEKKVVLLDWEVVGVGSGPQDLAQYAISHMTRDSRRAQEPALLKAYVDELAANGTTLSMDMCMKQYVEGGVGRWVWLLAILTDMVPPKMVQYFHDQLNEFIIDHGVTPETVSPCRS